MAAVEHSIRAPSAATSQAVSLTGGVSAQSAVQPTSTAIVTPTVDCFVLAGADPTAVVNTCQILLAGQQYRIFGIPPGGRLAFIAAVAGTVYVTPGE